MSSSSSKLSTSLPVLLPPGTVVILPSNTLVTVTNFNEQFLTYSSVQVTLIYGALAGLAQDTDAKIQSHSVIINGGTRVMLPNLTVVQLPVGFNNKPFTLTATITNPENFVRATLYKNTVAKIPTGVALTNKATVTAGHLAIPLLSGTAIKSNGNQYLLSNPSLNVGGLPFILNPGTVVSMGVNNKITLVYPTLATFATSDVGGILTNNGEIYVSNNPLVALPENSNSSTINANLVDPENLPVYLPAGTDLAINKLNSQLTASIHNLPSSVVVSLPARIHVTVERNTTLVNNLGKKLNVNNSEDMLLAFGSLAFIPQGSPVTMNAIGVATTKSLNVPAQNVILASNTPLIRGTPEDVFVTLASEISAMISPAHANLISGTLTTNPTTVSLLSPVQDHLLTGVEVTLPKSLAVNVPVGALVQNEKFLIPQSVTTASDFQATMPGGMMTTIPTGTKLILPVGTSKVQQTPPQQQKPPQQQQKPPQQYMFYNNYGWWY